MKRLRCWLPRLLIAAALLLAFLNWASRTETPALPAGVTREIKHLTLAGRSVSVTIYFPAHLAEAPLVVVAHGFTRSKRHMAGWGAALAGEGFIAAVPTQPALADHDLNARVLAELAGQFRSKQKVALMGFSMGGLTTLLAATKTNVDAWVGLDPVDMDGSGAKAAAKIKIPCAILRAEPEAWNMRGNSKAIIAAMKDRVFTLKVRNATHLDCESPTDLLGQLACGFVDPVRNATFKSYAISFLKATLMDDAEARKLMDGVKSDDRLDEVTIGDL